MRETPRPQGTAGDSRAELPQPCPGRALAHTTGAPGSGTPHRSAGRPPHTPRGERHAGQGGRPGTSPPVPGRPAFLFATLLCVFAVITWQVVSDGPLRRLDERIDPSLTGHGPSWLAEGLSDLGSMPVALPVLALAIGYALWRGLRRQALIAAVTMAIVPLLVVPLKEWTDRPGPFDPATGYYPSGHTATAMVAYGSVALLLSPVVRRRRALPVAAGVLTAATGTGLVLHGYHWPLDVLASCCLCGALLVLSSTGMRRSSSRTRRR
ncbi:phosphatase PAP2 family protein [Streptomyces xanthochromogenes]|uniref:phosphatase PAP2 family protein n=1 Tax=Streptomyces xanthochromogenes TaxID=67384 RepID=UPI00167255F6|nr:phosphatase PAP2 family protein [Streptomyces xanthochromogenes]